MEKASTVIVSPIDLDPVLRAKLFVFYLLG